MDDSPAVADGTVKPRNRRLTLALGALAAAVILADQVSKCIVVRELTGNVPVSVVDGWLQLRLVRNPGAAFSMATGMTWVFTVIAIVVSVVVIRVSRQLGSWWWALALGFLLGGAVGNLLDRLFRMPGFARGHVVDFIEYLQFPFIDFPVFNIADSSITTAAVLIALTGIRGIGIDGRRSVD